MSFSMIFRFVLVLCSFGCTLQGADVTPSLLEKIASCKVENQLNKVFDCGADKILESINYMSSQPRMELYPGITLVNKNPLEKIQSATVDVKLLKQQGDGDVLDMIYNTSIKMITDRNLEIKIPTNVGEIAARSFQEGRAKMKDALSPVLMLLGGVLVSVLPIMFGGLGLFATKAMMIGKIAIVVSIIAYFQYFLDYIKHTFSSHVTSSYNPPTLYGSSYPYFYGHAYPYGPSSLAVHDTKLAYARSFGNKRHSIRSTSR